ncbi:hypothetical protein HK099_008240 [Clydaea vesicula]|uniref:Exportin-5 n=1 Tax=Clydaea vesicula TaxID=447962 RepID=A0AAD5U6A9_9FUNG|nr:hypothetical protein HK099_008240 [Clydaea vesicula]
MEHELIEAINLIYNPTSHSDQRRAATEFLESIKSLKEAPFLGHKLAHKNNNQQDHIRHYGLSLLENSVKFNWTKFSSEEAEKIKLLIQDLLNEGIKDINEEKLFTKEKLVKVTVEVAKRMWPMQWPDFNYFLKCLYDQNPTTRELSVLILRSLYEDVFLYEDVVAQKRKSELTTALFVISYSYRVLGASTIPSTTVSLELNHSAIYLTPNLDTFLSNAGLAPGTKLLNQNIFSNLIQTNAGDVEGWLSKWTSDLFILHQNWCNEFNAGYGKSAEISELLIVSILSAISVAVHWASLYAIIDTAIVPRLLDLIISPSRKIRLGVTEVLFVLFSRPVSSNQEAYRYDAVLKPIFEVPLPSGNIGLENLILAWAKNHCLVVVDDIDRAEQNAKVSEDDYIVIKRLAQAITALGENYVCHKTTKKIPNLIRFLEEMLVLSDHPSLIVAMQPTNFWTLILRHESLKVSEEVLAVMPPLLELSAKKVSKSEAASKSNLNSNYSNIDFDGHTEQLAFGMLIRQKYLEICKLIAINKPLDSYKWMLSRIEYRFGSIPNPEELTNLTGRNNLNQYFFAYLTFSADGLVTFDTPFYHHFEADVNIMSIVLSVLPYVIPEGNTILKAELFNSVELLLSKVIGFESNDPLLIRTKIDAVTAFSVMIPYDLKMLSPFFAKLFEYVSFHQPFEKSLVTSSSSGWYPQLSIETKIIRKKAAAFFAKMGSTMPNILIKIYDDLSRTVFELVEKDLINYQEQNFLMECLLAIIYFNTALSYEEKIAPFQAIVNVTMRSFEILNNFQIFDLRIPDENLGNVMQEFLGIDFLAKNCNYFTLCGCDSIFLGDALNEKEKCSPLVLESLNRTKATRFQCSKPFFSISQLTTRTLQVKKSEDFNADHELWGDYALRVVPYLIGIIRGLHSLADPAKWESLPPLFYNTLTSVTYMERMLILGRTIDPTENEISKLNETYLEKELKGIKEFLNHARDHSQILPHGISTKSNYSRHFWLCSSYRKQALDIFTKLNSKTVGVKLSGGLVKLDSEWKILMDKGSALDKKGDEFESLIDEMNYLGGDKMEDISDEIFAEKVLRNLTRSVVNFFSLIFDVKKSTGEPPDNYFQHKELAEFFLKSVAIASPLMTFLFHILVYQDSTSSRKSVNICTHLVNLIMPSDENSNCGFNPYHILFGQDLVVSALDCLRDPYHQEVHFEAVNLIGLIYSKLLIVGKIETNDGLERIREIFSGLPGKGIQATVKFENEFVSRETFKEQVMVLREFLADVKGLSVSQRGRKPTSFLLNISEKNLLVRPKIVKSNVLDEEDNSDMMENLFK